MTASAQAADRPMPSVIDPAKRYMFYMHGIYVERQGPFEAYHYYDILEVLEARGFVVIGEARTLSNAGRYAKGVARQIQTLLDAGVPSYHITVAGHSKGGLITLYVAALLGETGINYAVFSGCGRAGTEYRRDLNKFMKLQSEPIEGNFLVAWAEDDQISGDCNDALKGGKAVIRNLLLPAGFGGNKVFYNPEPMWIDTLTAFASGG
jgi:triacylglycerol esterase/lipase EstA (alpha/beta hydrolase family)